MKSKIHDTSESELAKQCKKINFKAMSKKKSILLFLSIAFVALASSQTLISDKQKTAVQKDTVKKNRTIVEQEEIVSDSLLLQTGDFKFYKKSAHASYYADKFHGRRTTSGKKYDKNKYTAAHKKLPFGTKVKVTNEANGKSVIVEITDRGPFVRAREIDLSRRAFKDITNNMASGAMKVTIEILQK
ncbi:MAG TPA: septal ring lytic transglycosylase RlpA family protein [Flavobacterium sp.]